MEQDYGFEMHLLLFSCPLKWPHAGGQVHLGRAMTLALAQVQLIFGMPVSMAGLAHPPGIATIRLDLQEDSAWLGSPRQLLC